MCQFVTFIPVNLLPHTTAGTCHTGILHRHTSTGYAYRQCHTAITKNQENNKPLRARRKN